MRNKREDRSLYLACSKKFNLLIYSNHLRRHWEPGLIKPLKKSRKSYRIIEILQPCTFKKFESRPAPLTFSSWNQIIKDIRNIYKLKELIGLPASTINNV